MHSPTPSGLQIWTIFPFLRCGCNPCKWNVSACPLLEFNIGKASIYRTSWSTPFVLKKIWLQFASWLDCELNHMQRICRIKRHQAAAKFALYAEKMWLKWVGWRKCTRRFTGNLYMVKNQSWKTLRYLKYFKVIYFSKLVPWRLRALIVQRWYVSSEAGESFWPTEVTEAEGHHCDANCSFDAFCKFPKVSQVLFFT